MSTQQGRQHPPLLLLLLLLLLHLLRLRISRVVLLCSDGFSNQCATTESGHVTILAIETATHTKGLTRP